MCWRVLLRLSSRHFDDRRCIRRGSCKPSNAYERLSVQARWSSMTWKGHKEARKGNLYISKDWSTTLETVGDRLCIWQGCYKTLKYIRDAYDPKFIKASAFANMMPGHNRETHISQELERLVNSCPSWVSVTDSASEEAAIKPPNIHKAHVDHHSSKYADLQAHLDNPIMKKKTPFLNPGRTVLIYLRWPTLYSTKAVPNLKSV